MSGAAILWQDPAQNLVVRVAREPGADAVALLAGTVWGSRDTRYRILGMEEKLARLRDPYFIRMERSGGLEAVGVLDRCRKQLLGRSIDTMHFAMIATRPDRRQQGLAGQMVQAVRSFCEAELGRPAMGFAYVEATTEFSLRIADEVGCPLAAELPLTLFTRLWPRADPRVAPGRPQDRAELLDGLGALYADHVLADFAHSLRPEDCLVLREGGRIVAAAQTEPLRWAIESLPGLSGCMLLRLLPFVPGLRRVADPLDLRLVRFGGLLARPGRETALAAVLETALAQQQSRIGLTLLDRRSPVLHRLRSSIDCGWLAGLVRGGVEMRADILGLSDAEAAAVRSRPVVVSPADVF